MSNLIYGLYFGTSNSAVAVLDERGHSQVLNIGQNGLAKTIPSVLFFPDQSTKTVYTGDLAIQHYLSSGQQGRFLQSIKSILPSEDFTGTKIPGFGVLTSEDLVSLVIKNLKERADALTGSEVKRVVIGRPAKFSENRRLDILAEHKLAGTPNTRHFLHVLLN
jgi:hypothetical chaperone protein